ncbi:hypothetical protein AVEN_149416-1 [Araneus ventricosus]|uniref:Uncharacterized protein n=1 Tax=Araneus ventricosus TaxID=182803 RepID=A0A4Y2PAH7_ARAVE|nr:hypothetical protein AVEN_149416-1 [Araneus ventricosus]
MIVDASVPSVHQRIEIGIEEISVEVVESLLDALLNFDIGSEMPTSQVLLSKRCKSHGARIGLMEGVLIPNRNDVTEVLCGWGRERKGKKPTPTRPARKDVSPLSGRWGTKKALVSKKGISPSLQGQGEISGF